MAVKLNNDENYEHLCNVRLTKDKFPMAYEAKRKELIEMGMPENDVDKYLETTDIELELYYSPYNGVFAVETAAVEAHADIFDPYTGELCEDADE